MRSQEAVQPSQYASIHHDSIVYTPLQYINRPSYYIMTLACQHSYFSGTSYQVYVHCCIRMTNCMAAFYWATNKQDNIRCKGKGGRGVERSASASAMDAQGQMLL